jgi:predicted flap endonuclease-1-like 5' DNA nuclease
MMAPVCSLWWLLAAVLVGWLLCGWFARQYLPRVTNSGAGQDREIARLKAELAALRAQPPVEKVVERVVERIVEVPAPAPMPAPAVVAATMPLAAPVAPPIDLDAARAAGFSLKGPDDLEVVEGIGPKIAQIFRDAGVTTFAQLAAMAPAQIQPLLDAAGPNFRIANPATWPEQSALAAANRWAELKALQDSLTAGRKA